MLGPSSGDSKTSTTPVLGINSASGDGVNNFSTKTHQVSETNYNIGGSNSISAGDEEDRVGVIDNNSSAKVEEGDRSFGGNRWPRQETLALLQIRSDMDVAFRDATVKAPLWDAISRKLAELGYNRSAKKCKEKFENVYKYHKRTKEGRSGKPDGKNYRFFDQLKALENQPSSSSSPHNNNQPKTIQQIQAPSTTMVVTSMINNPPLTVSHQNSTVPSVSHQQPNTINLTFPSFQTPTNPTFLPPSSTFHPSITANTNTSAFQSISAELFSNSTSSSTSSDEQEFEESMRRNKKRKWKDFFERLMVEVIRKQEELQNKFLEAIEKREHERMVREEAWRMQEISRINREREILSQERSMAAAKDAAVLAFLQKISEQQNQNQNQNIGTQPQNIILQTPVQLPVTSPMPILAPTQPPPLPQLQQMLQPRQASTTNVENTPTTKQAAAAAAADNNGEHNELMPASSSRWPKVEIEALIKLRTTLDAKYQENSPKGPLWEEISASMKKLGYNRNAKRCKEKWENINKYYKKVKESNKKRPEDSKTCPYFSQLEALYKEKNKFENTQMNNQFMKPEINSIPIMVRPEQQWPPQQENNNNEEDDPMDQNQEEDDRDGDEDEDEDEEDDESDGNYELVANKSANNNSNNIAVSSATAV